MSQLHWGWADFWGCYRELNEDEQTEMLEQLDLQSYLKSKSSAVQLEILRNAPHEVVTPLKNIIHKSIYNRLGIINSDFLRMSLQ